MTSFVEGELEKLAETVAAKVLAELQPQLDSLVNTVVARVEAVVDAKLANLH